MSAKKSKESAESKQPEHTLRVVIDGSTTRARALANVSLQPEILAAYTTANCSSGLLRGVPINDRVDELQAQVRAVQGGDLKRAEAMLVAQAHSLDTLFNEMVRRAALNWNEHLAATDAFLKIALRAQSQCRATWETLATIKNPPVIFAKQANIANGPQQVNNGTMQQVARAEETEIKQPELLERDHAQRVDTGTTGTAGRSDPAMAAVEAFDRPNDGSREGNV